MESLIKSFEQYRGEKIALYGLGEETPKALSLLGDFFDVIGLLDSFEVSGEMYGQSIVSLDQAISQGIKLVIVVARPGSCKAIAKKIGQFCKQHEVDVFDIRGNNLLEVAPIVYDFKMLRGYRKEDVLKKIEQADVVSFDLFDTLVTRNTLYPTDVIDIVNARLREKGILIPDFVKRRLGEEKRLRCAPRLCEIYDKASDNVHVAISAEALAELEYETDLSLLVPRRDVVALLAAAKEMGKSVYITSDTYYSKAQILGVLDKCGIEGFDDVLASCEYGTGKVDNLFSSLINIVQTKNIVHIGDDMQADVLSAEKNGIKALRLYSGQDLWDALGGLGLSGHTEELADRIKIGMFVASIFNSPFQFEEENCRIRVQDAYDIGYLFCAPMISDFVRWFWHNVRDLQIENIWFGARDGYLIQRMSRFSEPEEVTVYFHTSRIAAIRAGVQSKKDVCYVDAMKYSGKLEENLWERFGIEASTVANEDFDVNETGLMRYTPAILKSAVPLRNNYRKYIEKQGLKNGEVAFFDFVAKGTVQLYLTKLVENPIKGLYFLQLQRGSIEGDICIESFYLPDEAADSAIYDNYYILETVLTAPHASVSAFDGNGNPIYAKETRTESDIACAMRAQEGIYEYYKKYLEICPMAEVKENKKLDEIFLTLIRNVKIEDPDFLKLFVEDPFFNRMTRITDVL